MQLVEHLVWCHRSGGDFPQLFAEVVYPAVVVAQIYRHRPAGAVALLAQGRGQPCLNQRAFAHPRRAVDDGEHVFIGGDALHQPFDIVLTARGHNHVGAVASGQGRIGHLPTGLQPPGTDKGTVVKAAFDGVPTAAGFKCLQVLPLAKIGPPQMFEYLAVELGVVVRLHDGAGGCELPDGVLGAILLQLGLTQRK